MILKYLPILCLLILAATLSGQEARASQGFVGLPNAPMGDLWQDRHFVESFIGSYGFLSGVEPRVADSEAEQLRATLGAIERSPAEAIRLLENEITDSSSAAFDFILGNLYFQTDRQDRAEAAYRAALNKFPSFRRAHKNLALLLVRQDRFEEAAEALSRAVELGDMEGRTMGLLGYTHLQLAQYYPAELAYRQAILMQPQTLDWQTGLVRALLATERHGEAIALLASVLKRHQERADLWLLQANAHLAEGNRLAAARSLEIAHRLGERTPRSLVLLGDIYFREEIMELALPAYLSAVELADATQAGPLLRAADLLIRRGETAKASELVSMLSTRLSDRLGRSAELELLIIQARLARAEGDNERARELLEAIVTKDSLNGAALIELGNLYADAGKPERAQIRFEQAQNIPASEREALIANAQMLVRERELGAAIPLLRRALNLRFDQNLETYLQRVERSAGNTR